MFPHGVGLSCISRLSDRRFLGNFHNSWQSDREGRATARLALDRDVTAHHLRLAGFLVTQSYPNARVAAGPGLPVDTMTIEELADVVARLEEAGIAVEIDAGMLTPHRRKMTLPEVNPTPEPTRHSERAMTAHARLQGE
jgi:hypothetical protein